MKGRDITVNQYNLDLINNNDLSKQWEMPIIYNDEIIPTDLIGFNYAKTSKNKNCGIHFYLDDYQFERVWNRPQDYIRILQEYECILSPDFSLYTDMPIPLKIYNTYRNRLIGNYYQKRGIKVIPTLCWADEDTYDYAFDGLEKNGIYSISTVGIMQNKKAKELCKKGIQEAIKRLKPKTILLYGNMIDFDFKNIKIINYPNRNVQKWR